MVWGLLKKRGEDAMKRFNAEASGLNREDYEIIDIVTKLPHKILKHHEVPGLAHIVLHDLAHESGFGLEKAAYFVDNPDFDHMVGVAGFCKNECHLHKKNVWNEPHNFKQDMEQAEFNTIIRGVFKNSFNKKHIDTHDFHEISDLGQAVGITNPSFFTWNMHHGNHGLLIFEPSKEISVWRHSLLSNVVALLSMCGRH
jgi:hypothetical protein